MFERLERIKFDLDLDYAQAQAHRTAVAVLTPQGVPVLFEGDTLKLTYSCYVSYAGEVIRSLEAIAELLDAPGVVLQASLEELNYGRCLFAEVVAALNRVIAKKEARPT